MSLFRLSFSCLGLALLGLDMVLLATMGCKRGDQEAEPRANYAEIASDEESSDPAKVEASRQKKKRAGVDVDDDPNGPEALPKSNDLPNWIKVKPVRIISLQQIGQVIPDQAMAGAMQTFHLKRMAHCGYESAGSEVNVLLIEAKTSDDAFGVYTLLSRNTGHKMNIDERILREIQVDSDEWKMVGWRGSAILRMSFSASSTETSLQPIVELFNHIVFGIPPADEFPLAFKLFPPERLVEARLWLVRGVEALKVVKDVRISQVAGSDLNGRLGLTGDELLCIAALPPGRGIEKAIEGGRDVASSRPASFPAIASSRRDNLNYVWIAIYKDLSSAAAARERYATALKTSKSELDRKTLIAEPLGRYLLGSWTSTLESRQPLLPEVRQSLAKTTGPGPTGGDR